jgi:hypothetical protein
MGWLIVPVLTFFLLMQLLRWIVPPAPEATTEKPSDPDRDRITRSA